MKYDKLITRLRNFTAPGKAPVDCIDAANALSDLQIAIDRAMDAYIAEDREYASMTMHQILARAVEEP